MLNYWVATSHKQGERSMDLGLANARVVVTGGASNIGRGIVHEFATEGAGS